MSFLVKYFLQDLILDNCKILFENDFFLKNLVKIFIRTDLVRNFSIFLLEFIENLAISRSFQDLKQELFPGMIVESMRLVYVS
jgi:hypothetical protein